MPTPSSSRTTSWAVSRLDPATDGRPDSRPNVRENLSLLGDLVNDFDFEQPPRLPLLLQPCPNGYVFFEDCISKTQAAPNVPGG